METWESIWQELLKEACLLASEQPQNRARQIGRASASIVLACVSWEAFINELIQWRSLVAPKKADFLPKLKKVLRELGALEQGRELDPAWNDLHATMQLRNLIVHHKADPYKSGTLPHGLSDSLKSLAVFDRLRAEATWERALVNTHTADACCRIVAASILRLEHLPLFRRRKLAEVEQGVAMALKPLAQRRIHARS